MEIIKGSLADNSQIEQPYRTKGKIFFDENGTIITIYIEGIIVDFETVIPIDKYTRAENFDGELIDMGWEKITGKDKLKDWIWTDKLSSLEWDGKERNYFDF